MALPSSPVSEIDRASEVVLEVLGRDLVLRGPLVFQDPWERLWRPFRKAAAAPGAIEISVLTKPWGYQVLAPGLDSTVVNPWRALIESRNFVIQLALEEDSGLVDLHAAVLIRDELALLLVGDAWAGKTTLALDLVEKGWVYYSDDVALFEPSTGRIRPFPKPPAIKAQPWQTLKHHWDPEPEGLGIPDGPFVIPPPFRGRLSLSARPAWVVLLEYRKSSPIEVHPLTPGIATSRIAAHLRHFHRRSINVVAGACLGSRSFAISYGDPEEAARTVDQIGVPF